MPNWNRLLVGGTFTRQPGGVNYYRDVFLLWPFLGFSMAATSCLIEPKFFANRIDALKWAFCAAVVLFLAKEKRYLLIVAPAYVCMRATPAYVCMRTTIASVLIHSREAFLWTLVSGLALFVLFRSRYIKEWKPSYILPRKLYVLDVAVAMAGLAAMLLVFQWITL
jgi:hypothetical protein